MPKVSIAYSGYLAPAFISCFRNVWKWIIFNVLKWPESNIWVLLCLNGQMFQFWLSLKKATPLCLLYGGSFQNCLVFLKTFIMWMSIQFHITKIILLAISSSPSIENLEGWIDLTEFSIKPDNFYLTCSNCLACGHLLHLSVLPFSLKWLIRKYVFWLGEPLYCTINLLLVLLFQLCVIPSLVVMYSVQ